jgi:hypothetical protein
MISKLFLTILLIVGLVYYIRSRSSARPPEPRRRERIVTPAPRHEPLVPRAILYIFIALMLLATSVVLYFDWEKNYRVVTVRVINSDTGRVSEYQARRGDIDGRTFETLDGKVVTLADVERMELELSNERE